MATMLKFMTQRKPSDEPSEPTSAEAVQAPSFEPAGWSAPAGGAASLAGTWRFRLDAPRLNHATGNYAGGTVSIADNKIVVEGPAYARSETPVGYAAGDHEIECRGDLCSGGSGSLPYAFQSSGSNFQVVHRATLQPDNAGAGGSCEIPSVPRAGLIDDLDGTSFSFLTGFSGGHGLSNCYQVLFTVKASKVSA